MRAATFPLTDSGSRSACQALLLPRAGYEAAYVARTGKVGFAFESQTGVHAFGSDRRSPFRARPNSLSFIPAGCDVYSRSAEGGEYLLIDIEHWHPPDARRFNDVVDPAALQVACRMRQLLLRAPDVDALDLEAGVLALMDAVSRVCGVREATSGPARWITPRRLQLIDEWIDARMQERLTVGELADALGLSTGFFMRAFRAGVGRTPHDYIMEKRVSRARMLLAHSALTLAEVAATAGFASQAHMTTTFRRRLNLTPRALRALLAGQPSPFFQ